MEENLGLGMIHVYTGDGKGKTTSSIGLGIRAAGHGFKVYMIQFMKGQINYGELETVKLIPNFEIRQFGRPDFVDKNNPEEIDIQLAKEGLAHAKDIVSAGEVDMLILDEVNVAVEWGLFSYREILELIKNKPKNMELVLTGRHAPREFIELADTVTEMKEIKHPYMEGITARKGIEF